ncbi:MAG: phage holin family protein [Patescibacteria group bacterium]
MRFIARLIASLVANIVGLLAAGYWVAGFTVTHEPKDLIIIGTVLMALNATLKPVLKLFLGPIIVLTLGLGAIFVSALIFLLLDFLLPGLSIATIPALLWSSLLIGLINAIFHFAFKS